MADQSAPVGSPQVGDELAERRRLVERSAEELAKTSMVLTELASAQGRLVGELRGAVAALPQADVVEQLREATDRLAAEVRSGHDRLRLLLLAEGVAFLILACVIVFTARP